MKKYILSFSAIMLAIALAWGTSSYKTPKVNSYFYQFNGDPTNETQVKSASEYTRVTTACSSDAGSLCGIYLPTDEGLGNPPSTSDFNPNQSQLWTSAQSGTAAASNIEMRSE
jgi:hypothetical protein